jgi:hypothetical protein
VEAPLRALSLSGFDNATLLSGGTSRSLAAPVVVSAPSFRGPAWFLSSALPLEAARFAMSGNATGGGIALEGDPAVIPSPRGVVGRDVSLALSAREARSVGSFRATQVLAGAGYLVPSQVEAGPEQADVTVAHGNTTWLAVDYRERTGEGDAVLADVNVTGDGAGLVEVPTEGPPPLVEEMLAAAASGSPPGNVFARMAVTLASPAIVLVDLARTVACAVAGCPEDHPFPAWMDAGSVGTFYLQVRGDAPPGAYDASVTLRGANYDAVSIPVHIVVTA